MARRRAFLGMAMLWGGALAAAPMPKSSPSGEEVIRINCGATGWDFTDPRGNYWVKDEAHSSLGRWGYELGTAKDYRDDGLTIAPGLTDVPEVFLTQRFGGAAMRYVVDLPNGAYDVTLYFLEPQFTAANQRVFDVALQGTTVLDNFDIFSAAGGKARPYSRTFRVSVSDQQLTVTFPQVLADNACLSGLEAKVVSVSDANLLSFLQRKMISYFWTEADAATGLVSDKSNNWVDEEFSVASIATTGLALSVLTVAEAHGWMATSDVLARIHTTLDFFRQMQLDPNRSYHGFWFHFVDKTNGQRAWSSEVSTVDSALFIMGALQAGEYFRTTDPTVAQKAQQLYESMEWDWFTIPFASSIGMGWKPELTGDANILASDRGFFINNSWISYNESVFVNLLALGSPTHAVSSDTWREMRRHGTYTGGGFSGFMYFPALFAHQYHHLYYDFRNRHDGESDFWDATVNATLQDRAQCALDGRFEANIWGLTACETTTGGYTVYGAGPDGYVDGTAAPTGPITSIPMTPTESIAAARKMFFQYKHAIWGRHGFTDSFRLTDNGRSTNTLGLDNGPMVLAIENYRTGLVRDTFMRHPSVAQALTQAGFVAMGAAPRIFSSSEINGNHARFAFDADASTRWESVWLDEQWLAVDYGKTVYLNGLRLTWETAFGKDYRVQVSNDGNHWTTVASVANGDGGEDVVSFPKTAARMIRVYGDHRGGVGETLWGFSLFSMVPSLTVADQPPPPPEGEGPIAEPYPNPFRPGVDSYVNISGLAGGTEVRILTLRGERVRAMTVPEGSGSVTWDGTNESGRAVSSGVYLMRIVGNGQNKTTRIVIQR